MSATWTTTPQQFERVIGSVLPHTSDDSYVPVICCVNLEVSGDRFLAFGTDRYTMGVGWELLSEWNPDAEPQPDVTASVFAADLRRVLAFLRPHKKTRATWTLNADAFTVDVGGESLTVKTVDVTPIKWRTILGNRATSPSTGTPTMRFTPSKIESFLKSARAIGVDGDQLVWRYGSAPEDPCLLQIGTKFLGLLMPQRLSENTPALDLAAVGIEAKAITAAEVSA